MTSENMQFRSFTRDVGVLGLKYNASMTQNRGVVIWFQVIALSGIFCWSFIPYGRWNNYCSEKPLKFVNQQSGESGCSTDWWVTCRDIILLFSERGGSRLSPNLTFREFSFNMEGMAHVSEETASPFAQLKSCLRSLTLTLSLFATSWSGRLGLTGSALSSELLSWAEIANTWDTTNGGQWTLSGGFFQKSRHPLAPMSRRGVSSTNQTDLDEKMHSKEPDCFWRSKKDESVNFCSKWEAEL